MNSLALAGNVLKICEEATQRILTVGHDQYSTTEEVPEGNEGLTKPVQTQKIETDPMPVVLDELEEELLDTINHSAMAVMRLRELRKAARLA